ncbi:methyl-CpG-binding domain-containing protein 6-like isoform X4 [Primulina tabacum]|uniref:methyl-CpG-binding domain-containing protein 6-like isoform X4 n=1 Tax=Primulina tabacum TaxID=48773 RepID=UPI003F597E16
MEIEHVKLVLIPIALQALLGSGSFIESGCNDSAIKTSATERHETNGDPEFASDSVIDAKPISMLALGEVWSEATPRAPKVRDPEEMAKRPSWLPEGCNVETRVRSSGATAATIDQYYVAPSGKRKLRSKNEVLRFLASEGEPKRESNSETDAGSSESPGSQKKPKSSSKRKKAGAVA